MAANTSSCIDNNVLTRIIEGAAGKEEAAFRFARRRTGLLRVIEEVRAECLTRHSVTAFDEIMRRFGMQVLPSAPGSDVTILAHSLGIVAPSRMIDLMLLATARRSGIGLVTGDRGLFSAALRSGYTNVEYRIFQGDLRTRIATYHRIRALVSQHWPDLPPTIFTGSRVGR